MKKISSVIALLFGIVALFSIAGCSMDTKNYSQSKVDEMQSQMDELQSQIDEMQSQIDKLQDKIDVEQSQISKTEAEILKHYYEPTIDEDFEDNKVWIILKSSYNISEIGFKDFEIVEQVAEIASITAVNKTITREDGVKVSLKRSGGRISQLILLELATHDKEKVLAVIAQLNKLDMVLVSGPDYIYIAVDD